MNTGGSDMRQGRIGVNGEGWVKAGGHGGWLTRWAISERLQRCAGLEESKK
jgi:hypothetical protein